MCPTYPRIGIRKPKGWPNKSFKDHVDHVRAGHGLRSRVPQIRSPRLASKEYRMRQYTRQQIGALSRFGGVLLTILESSDVKIKASNGSTLDVSACAQEIDSWVQIIKACVSGAKGHITGFGDVRVERDKLILSKDLLFGAVEGSLSLSLTQGISLGFSVFGKKVMNLKPRANDVEVTFFGTIKAKVKYQKIWNELSSKPSASTHGQALYTSLAHRTHNSKPTGD